MCSYTAIMLPSAGRSSARGAAIAASGQTTEVPSSTQQMISIGTLSMPPPPNALMMRYLQSLISKSPAEWQEVQVQALCPKRATARSSHKAHSGAHCEGIIHAIVSHQALLEFQHQCRGFRVVTGSEPHSFARRYITRWAATTRRQASLRRTPVPGTFTGFRTGEMPPSSRPLSSRIRGMAFKFAKIWHFWLRSSISCTDNGRAKQKLHM